MCETKEILISEQKEFEVNMVVSSNKKVLTKEIILKAISDFISKNQMVCGVSVEEIKE